MVLALFPALLKKMPKSGNWLNSVKVVMGFIELAAALKFLRAGERLLTSNQTTFLTFNLVLGLYVAICFACALYLLCVYRLPHDTPTENIGVMRMMMGLTFVALGLYLMPALFQADAKGNTQKPKGAVFAWISSFILSDNEYLEWKPTLEEGLAEARKNPGKRIFIDFTGINCTNCNINEDDVFPLPEVQERLQQYVLVKLYTDTVPAKYYRGADRSNLAKHEADAGRNLKFQKDHFKTEQLPLYVIMEPADNADGFRTVAVYPEGKINFVNQFVEFLSDNAGIAAK
jgi:thiol:disulfide interchange protein DsbD